MEHRPFLVALGLGAVLRVIVCLGFVPGLMISDATTYLQTLEDVAPDPDRPVGYVLLLLLPVSWVSDTVLAYVIVQHLVGLVTAFVLYTLLRHWGVGRRLSTVAALPVLFDSMQLILEHTPLSDTLFSLLVVSALGTLAWHRQPSLVLALAAGLLLGTSATVRQVGMPLVVVGVAYCLLVQDSWRARLGRTAVLCLGFVLPVAAYVSWYHAEHDVFRLSGIGAQSAYMRTTSFVECSGLPVPEYQRVLCPPEPRGERLDPTDYGWNDERTVPRLAPPPGISDQEAMRDFATTAIREQPLDYVTVVARDFMLNFDVVRGDRFEFNTAWKWRLSSYLDYQPTRYDVAALDNHGGRQLVPHQPFADVMTVYERFGYLPGPLLLGCLLLGTVGACGRAGRPRLRARCMLLTVSGSLLLLVPVVTIQFVWRYQLPALALLPAAAALAVTARRPQRHGTVATASTD